MKGHKLLSRLFSDNLPALLNVHFFKHVINCSRTKYEATTVNVLIFFRLEEDYWFSTVFKAEVMTWNFDFSFRTLTSVFEQRTLKVA